MTNNQQPTPLLLEYLERIFYWCRALDVAAQIDEQRGDEDYQWPIDAVLLDDPDQIIDQIRALSSLGSQTDVDEILKNTSIPPSQTSREYLQEALDYIYGRGLLKTGETDRIEKEAK